MPNVSKCGKYMGVQSVPCAEQILKLNIHFLKVYYTDGVFTDDDDDK